MTRPGALIISAIVALQLLAALAKRLEVEEFPEKVRYLFQSDLDTWDAPPEFYKNYTYYLSGFDEDDRPVWVIELGKWDIRGALSIGEEYELNFTKYVEKGIYRVLSSIGERENEDGIREVILIFDMEGYTLDQLNYLPAVTFILRTIRLVLECANLLSVALVINTNFVAQTLINVARPVLGKEFNRVDVYGTNPARWRPVLLKKIPKDQLPEWYGGNSDFKPLRVYG